MASGGLIILINGWPGRGKLSMARKPAGFRFRRAPVESTDQATESIREPQVARP
jgi:hypothetical protein